MPFKSETTFTKIYLNNGDSFIPLEGIEDAEIDTEFPPLDETIIGLVDEFEDISFTANCTNATIRNLLRAIASNNWRKMHGLPMIRKTVAERRRKKCVAYTT